MAAGCSNYDFQQIEQFWQNYWLKNKVYKTSENKSKPKYYILDMFPYPSGAGLHIGHPEGYTASDIIARYKIAKGFNVLHPMGWDAFGLPAEQHAMATGQHPAINTEKNVRNFRKQIQALGFAIDWDREINTTDPQYFKWTQWIFLQLFKYNLAYIDDKPVWWCPELKAVLANEEVINGRSERGHFPVERKNLRQWVLRITKYADKLLSGLSDLNWPESTKRQQTVWIGKSTGAEIKFAIKGHQDSTIEVYTTRPDTICGVSFLVLAPEHPLVNEIITDEHRSSVEEYCESIKSKSDLERTDLAKDKTGVFTGAYAINPITEKEIPIWIADYVLMSYGKGAIMAVPAHDTRDYEFATKFNLEIIPVIAPEGSSTNTDNKEFNGDNENTELTDTNESENSYRTAQVDINKHEIIDGTAAIDSEEYLSQQLPYISRGKLINSLQFSGMSSDDASDEIIKFLEDKHLGIRATNFKLRDWIFSRQRYWGEPIPIVWIEKSQYLNAITNEECYFKSQVPSNPVEYIKDGQVLCAIPLHEKLLPLELPPVDNYHPSENGESPLARASQWLNIFVNIISGEIKSQQENEYDVAAVRETNTMPQWAGSCWYYLRYMSPQYDNGLVDPLEEQYWKSPDFYIGGAEHAVLHLLYARFWHQFLYDIGAIKETKEPFQRLFHQGIILGQDGTKMSKSRGNVINPDDIIKSYGADALRLYEMFLGPLDAMKPWNTQGIEGVFRFLKKVWSLVIDDFGSLRTFAENDPIEVAKSLNYTIKKVGDDIENLQFNTAISQMMIFVNHAQKFGVSKNSIKRFLQVLSPFAPHICEELWSRLGEKTLITYAQWPEVIDIKDTSTTAKIIVQINGKVRDEIIVDKNASQEEVVLIASQREKVKKFLDDKDIIKIIYVPGKIINVVVK